VIFYSRLARRAEQVEQKFGSRLAEPRELAKRQETER
jgi:hypothetical protein